jgi:hypothetical protein
MSSPQERQNARAQELISKDAPLATVLAAIGINVPDQIKVKRMMEAIRLGLRPTATQRRIDWASWRRRQAFDRNIHWAQYDYDAYLRGMNHPLLLENVHVPDVVRADADRIKQAIPTVELHVHALKKDPWLECRLGKKSCFVRGWMGDRILA